MRTKKFLFSKISLTILFLFIFLVSSGCGPSEDELLEQISVSAEQTVVAIPSATPLPNRWEVELVSAEFARKFGTWYIPDDNDNVFVVITLEYTYNGQARTTFLPESVVLADSGNEGFMGWSKTPDLYQAETSTQVVAFQEDSLLNYISPGISKTETFVWEWPDERFSKFFLLFPETEAIEIEL